MNWPRTSDSDHSQPPYEAPGVGRPAFFLHAGTERKRHCEMRSWGLQMVALLLLEERRTES